MKFGLQLHKYKAQARDLDLDLSEFICGESRGTPDAGCTDKILAGKPGPVPIILISLTGPELLSPSF